MKINNISNCTGCSVCYSVCPKSAILMVENNEGFLYPKVDDNKCVECGLCEKVCPAISPLKLNKSECKAFAAINNNETIRMESSSGGVFTAIAEKILQTGGKVFGARFSEDFKSLIHSWTDNLDGLKDFRGSKYLQSNIHESFKECERFLKAGETVLFSGTPCQIQGLKKYLRKEYDNLLTVDFICHGVPSPLLWKQYVEYHENIAASKVVNTSSRRKNCGWKMFSLWFAFANHSEYSKTLDKDPYMQMFLKDVCLRQSCYNCPAKGIYRVSDVTIADFWGIQSEHPDFDDDKGTSFVLVHNTKVIPLFSDVCKIKEIDLNSGLRHNPAMVKSCAKPKSRDTFFKDLQTLSFDKMIKKYAVTPWYMKGYKFVKRCGGKMLKVVGLKK
ncbi:MAG: Coenzyme F420 hydrogenase/dehydrogenase, beta subunit C-terminal domain [Bacteroidales bacterium]|nr:Coenzyme F420 hydrogenase/dehydrogenase, beta subunit C-terminal domain [Bacteroidales bacterium]